VPELNAPACEWPRPIPVSERLPELIDGTSGDKLLFEMIPEEEDYFSGWRIGWLEKRTDGYHWRVYGKDNDGFLVTHWLPMPPEPQCQSQ